MIQKSLKMAEIAIEQIEKTVQEEPVDKVTVTDSNLDSYRAYLL